MALPVSPGMSAHIEGTVTGIPNNNPLSQAKAVLYKVFPTDTIAFDSTYTNINGFYSRDFNWVRIPRPTIDKNRIHPNPNRSQTNIIYNAEDAGDYSMNIYSLEGSMCGEILFQEKIQLMPGTNEIKLKGGKAGTKLITITNGKETYTYKSIQIENTGMPITTEVTQNSPSYKSTLDEILTLNYGDLAMIKFFKNGYYTGDTILTIQEYQVINKQLQQIPYVFTTTLKPFLENGEAVTTLNPNYKLSVDWGNGNIQNYTPQNGIINIEKELYPINGLGNIWVWNDTTDYNGNGVLSWTIIREPNQKTNRANIAQNESNLLVPAYKTLVSLDSLDGKTRHLYTVRKKAEGQPGEWYRLDQQPATGFVISSGNSSTAYFMEIPPEVADSLDIVQFEFNVSNNQPIPQDQLDRAMGELMKVINLYSLPNGDELLPPYTIYSIASLSDPRWQAIVARGYDNSIKNIFYNGEPYAFRRFTNSYTYNGEDRIFWTEAWYSTGNGNSQIFEESYSAVSGIAEATGNLAGYIYTYEGTPSELGRTMLLVPNLLNLGTH